MIRVMRGLHETTIDIRIGGRRELVGNGFPKGTSGKGVLLPLSSLTFTIRWL